MRIIISKDRTFRRRRPRIHQPSITLPQIPHPSRTLFGDDFELPYLGSGRSSNTHHAKSREGDIFSGNRCSGESHSSSGKWSDSHHDGLDYQKMMISIGSKMTRVVNTQTKPNLFQRFWMRNRKCWACECIFVNRSQNYLLVRRKDEWMMCCWLFLSGSFVARKILILCGCRVTVIVSCSTIT